MAIFDTTDFDTSVSYSAEVVDQQRQMTEILAWEASEYRRALQRIARVLPADYQPLSTDPDELAEMVEAFVRDADG